MTCDDAIGADASDIFNYLTGFSDKRSYQRFLVAPISLRTGVEALIRREMEHQRAGGDGHLIIKINALVDRAMIQLLYEASQAGVRVDLVVRGMCCLRPGVPGVSENIQRAQHRGPLPGAQPHLLVQQQRARGSLPGQRRPHGTQPGPPRGDPLPGAGPAAGPHHPDRGARHLSQGHGEGAHHAGGRDVGARRAGERGTTGLPGGVHPVGENNGSVFSSPWRCGLAGIVEGQ